jgi:hypothetical protein
VKPVAIGREVRNENVNVISARLNPIRSNLLSFIGRRPRRSVAPMSL